METVEIVGHIIGLLLGVVMGLIGGGGSLLLPVFLYLFGVDVELASAYTLVLVGITAALGVSLRLGRNEIDFQTGLVLAIPILIGTIFARWSIHIIPDNVFDIGGVTITKRMLVLGAFAIVLCFSFASMKGLIAKNLKPRLNFRQENPTGYYSTMISCGLFIGVLSGYVGAGGGVMIVPLLVVFLGMPMKTVVGTSLAIMAFKSLGFSGDVYQDGARIDWALLASFSVAMFTGIFLGSLVARRVHAKHLRGGFAWFILAMAIFIVVKEVLFAGATH